VADRSATRTVEGVSFQGASLGCPVARLRQSVCSISVVNRTIFVRIADYTSIVALQETRHSELYLSGYFLDSGTLYVIILAYQTIEIVGCIQT
jgi:hypothetical protein